jgi:hypothetical protein
MHDQQNIKKKDGRFVCTTGSFAANYYTLVYTFYLHFREVDYFHPHN